MNNYLIGLIVIIILLIILLISFIPGYCTAYTVPHCFIPTLISPTNHILSKTNHIVPKLIHRTWMSNDLSKVMYDNAYLPWIKLNPSYQMIWYNDVDVENYMKQYKREYRAFKKVICSAYKMDLFRLMILYEHGGCYVDSYTVPNVSIDEMIERTKLTNKDIFISILDCETIVKDGIHNGFIIVTPKHPFIKQVIEDVVRNIEYGKEEAMFTMTGPLALSKSIHKVAKNKKHQIGLNKCNYNYYLFEFPFSLLYQHIYDQGKLMFRKKMDILYCFMYQKVYKFLKNDKTSYVAASLTNKKVCYTDEELKELYNL